jgi:hypothetical protein
MFITDDLILRSRAKRGVSKDGQQRQCNPPFETALRASSGGEVLQDKPVQVELDNYLSISYEGAGANQAAVAVAREQCR